MTIMIMIIIWGLHDVKGAAFWAWKSEGRLSGVCSVCTYHHKTILHSLSCHQVGWLVGLFVSNNTFRTK